MPDRRQWVIDTSVFTHLCRAGHHAVISSVAPGGVVLVPQDVAVEIEAGRERHQGIPQARVC